MRKGFGLIELLVTVGVLSLLAAFAVPVYQLLLSQAQLSAATDQVVDLLRLSEQKTVTEQQIYGVTLSVSGTTIPQFLYNPGDGSKTVQSTYALPSAIQISEVNFSGNSDIRFTTSGSPNVSGNLVLRDISRNKSRRIEIRPSGAVLANQGEF